MNLNDLLKMFGDPEEMKRKMLEAQAKLAATQVTGSAGGGMVKVTLNGKMEAISCEIAPEVVDPKDVQILQDLVRAAVTDATARLRELLGAGWGMSGTNPTGLDPNELFKSFFGGNK
jgi:hypothetical protein